MKRTCRHLLLFALTALKAAAGDEPAPAGILEFRNDRGAITVRENGRPVLTCRGDTVTPDAASLSAIAPANQKYAKPRSDYLHPIFGPGGEVLTCDLPVDHPHHRGIYWAWPEVRWKGEMRDLHALQGVFARPDGATVAEPCGKGVRIRAQHRWLWDDLTPIVGETVELTVHPAGTDGSRAIDLHLTFTPLVEGVDIARRETTHYGGLNCRLAKAEALELSGHDDGTTAAPRRSWVMACGQFGKAAAPCTFAVLEHPQNPCYPGEFVRFPELSWLQPAFPAAGTRFSLQNRLVLCYRLFIAPGKATEAQLAAAWDELAAR